MLNVAKGKWAVDLLTALDIPVDRFPELRRAGSVAGGLRDLSVDEVMSKLISIKVPTTRVLNVDEAMANEQVRARGIVTEVEDATLGLVKVTAFPVVMDGVPRTGGRAAPRIGEHTWQVLEELGLEPGATAQVELSHLTPGTGSGADAGTGPDGPTTDRWAPPAC